MSSQTYTSTVSASQEEFEGDTYAEHGAFGRESTATSGLLEGFAVHVNAVFDAE